MPSVRLELRQLFPFIINYMAMKVVVLRAMTPFSMTEFDKASHSKREQISDRPITLLLPA